MYFISNNDLINFGLTWTGKFDKARDLSGCSMTIENVDLNIGSSKHGL